MEDTLRNLIYFTAGLLLVDCIDDLFLGGRWAATGLLVGLLTAEVGALAAYARLKKNGKKPNKEE